jgi:ectoine hydroxylase-related dioxygenase (phytanoyl-CoA dioxygenase family)
MAHLTKTEHLAKIEEQGFTVVEDAFGAPLADEMCAALADIEKRDNVTASNNLFEGAKTVRAYNLLARDPVFQQVPTNPGTLEIVEGVLDDGCLISSLSSVAIAPGERAQPIHSDEQIIALPRPHQALVCNSMWALTDFTEENGATRIIPGSHKADNYPDFGPDVHYDSVPAEMKRGSVLIWHGGLWHGGGANLSSEVRIGLAMNYCAGFIRQQENQQLGIPLELAATFSPRLQDLCGFGTYRDIIGHIDKQTAANRLLNRGEIFSSVWD